MFKRKSFLLVLFVFISVNINCATIITGRYQELPVISNPPGAIVTVGSSKQITPATFLLDRTRGIYVVKVEKEGYKSVEIVLKRGTNSWVLGNLFNGMIPGVVVDLISGSSGKFNPEEINVDFSKQELSRVDLNNVDVLLVELVKN